MITIKYTNPTESIIKHEEFYIKIYNGHYFCKMPVLYELIMVATHEHVEVIIKYFITRIKKS